IGELVLFRLEAVSDFADQKARPRDGAGMADDVAAEDQIVVIAANHDAGKSGVSLCRHAVVKQLIVLEYVAVGAHRLGLVAEKDAGLAVADNGVVAEKVVAVLVPDRDAVALVAAEL